MLHSNELSWPEKKSTVKQEIEFVYFKPQLIILTPIACFVFVKIYQTKCKQSKSASLLESRRDLFYHIDFLEFMSSECQIRHSPAT